MSSIAFKTEQEGKADARHDFEDGWIDPDALHAFAKDEKACGEFLVIMIGATPEYCSGYHQELKVIVAEEQDQRFTK